MTMILQFFPIIWLRGIVSLYWCCAAISVGDWSKGSARILGGRWRVPCHASQSFSSSDGVFWFNTPFLFIHCYLPSIHPVSANKSFIASEDGRKFKDFILLLLLLVPDNKNIAAPQTGNILLLLLLLPIIALLPFLADHSRHPWIMEKIVLDEPQWVNRNSIYELAVWLAG